MLPSPFISVDTFSLTLFALMDYSFWFLTVNLEWVIVCMKGVTGYNFQIKIAFLSLQVFAVCQSTHLGVTGIERVNIKYLGFQDYS